MSKTITNNLVNTPTLSVETDRGSRIAAVAAFAAAPADLALSDSLFAQAQQAINRQTARADFAPALEWAASRGSISAVIFAESLALGYLVSRSARLQGSYEGFDEYVEDRRRHMGMSRKALSKLINSPFVAMGNLGSAIETAGKPLTEHSSPRVRKWGKHIVDAGKVNAVGTTGVILEEAGLSKEPLPVGRIAKLGGLITASWVGLSEAVRYGYRGVGQLGKPGEITQKIIGGAGRVIDTLTSVDVFHPMSTPVGLATMGSAVVMLAVTGKNVVNYQEHQTRISDEVEKA